MSKIITDGFVSKKINGIEINGNYRCSTGNYERCSSRNIGYLVIHYTGNSKDTALSNAKYFQRAGRRASAHFFVDDEKILQSVGLKDIAWHCGTSKGYKHAKCRNKNAIGIEMCCTAGGYKISKKTQENAAYLCAHLCQIIGITKEQVDTYVLRHYDVTGKSCPAQMAGERNSEWNAFKSSVKEILANGAKEKDAVDYAPVFDATYYATKYPDLGAAGIVTEAALLNHFINFGMNEARQASKDFNVVAYKKNYEDLRAAFGDNWTSYYYHYINCGRFENRKGV